jgi:hypothetical protein
VDTLKTAHDSEASCFTRQQAEAVAKAIGDTGLTAVRRDVDVPEWMVDVVLIAAVFRQVFGLRGELAIVRETVGRIDGRLTGIETRLGAVEQRLGRIEDRLTGTESPPGPRP